MSSDAFLVIAGGLGLLGLALFAFLKAMPKRPATPSAENNWRRTEQTAGNGELRNDTLPTEHIGIGIGGNH